MSYCSRPQETDELATCSMGAQILASKDALHEGCLGSAEEAIEVNVSYCKEIARSYKHLKLAHQRTSLQLMKHQTVCKD
jgi:hypothetical protein